MVFSFEDLLATPAGYATPRQIAEAQALFGNMQKTASPDEGPKHPMGTVGNIAKSLFGALGNNALAAQERAMHADDARGIAAPEVPGGVSAPPSALSPDSVKPVVGGVPPATGLFFAGLAPEHVAHIKKFEGFTPNATWDVKQHSIGYGTKAKPGQTITPEQADVALNDELSKSAAIVDKVNPNLTPGTRAALISLTHNTGSNWVNSGLGKAIRAGDEKAAAAIFPQYNKVLKNGVLQTNQGVANRRQNELRDLWGKGAPVAAPGGSGNFGPNPLAFNGEPVDSGSMPPMPGSPEMAASALAPGGLGAGTPPMPKVTPVGPEGAPPSEAFTGRMQISREQIQHILSKPSIPQTTKDYFLSLYHQQNQPTQLETATGSWIRDITGKMTFVPKQRDIETKVGEITTKEPHAGTPQGGWNLAPGNWNTVAPPTAPETLSGVEDLRPTVPLKGVTPPKAAAPQIVPPRAAAPVPATTGAGAETLDNVPDLFAPEEGAVPKSMLQGLPPEILGGRSIPTPPGMDLGDAIPFGEAAPLGYAPNDATGAIDAAITPKAGTEGKTAQLSPRIESLAQKNIQLKAQQEAATEAAKKERDDWQKKYTRITDAGQTAASAKPMLELARQLVDDPKFYSGFGSGFITDIKRLKTALGIDPKDAQANEGFDKIISGQILNDMKISLQGLGQVRVAEIDLLNRAMANPSMSKAGNRLVLDLLIKAHDKATVLGEATTNIERGARYKWNPEANDGAGAMQPVRNAQGQVIKHPGQVRQGDFDAFLNEYGKHRPILEPKDIAELKKAMENPAGYGAPEKAQGKYAPERPQPRKKELNIPTPPAGGASSSPGEGYVVQ